jgi:hypothetical protein
MQEEFEYPQAQEQAIQWPKEKGQSYSSQREIYDNNLKANY